MALATTQEQLESVQASIAAAELAQEYELEEGQRVQRPNLQTLYDRESQLKARLAREQSRNSGGTQNRIRFVNPS